MTTHLPPYEVFLNITECTSDEYYFYPDTCEIPESFSKSTLLMSETTRSVCQHLCSQVYPNVCSGFLYRRETRSCVLTEFTANIPGDTDSCLGSSKEYYRRRRCISKCYKSVLLEAQTYTKDDCEVSYIRMHYDRLYGILIRYSHRNTFA